MTQENNSFEIILNGEKRLIISSNINDLLSELNLSSKRIAVELNREIVSRDAYADTGLSPGDTVEVVQFVGGG